MFTKQVKFRPIGEEAEKGGILVQSSEGDFIICGCCGGVFEMEDVEQFGEYSSWVDISEEIKGE